MVVCDASWYQGWYCAAWWDSVDGMHKPKIGRCRGSTQAEYIAGISALTAVEYDEDILLISDSKSLVKTITTKNISRKTSMQRYRKEIVDLVCKKSVISLHIPSKNTYNIHNSVDNLSKVALRNYLNTFSRRGTHGR